MQQVLALSAQLKQARFKESKTTPTCRVSGMSVGITDQKMLPLKSIELRLNQIGVKRLVSGPFVLGPWESLDELERSLGWPSVPAPSATPKRKSLRVGNSKNVNWKNLWPDEESTTGTLKDSPDRPRSAAHPSFERTVDTPEKTLDDSFKPGLRRKLFKEKIVKNYFLKKGAKNKAPKIRRDEAEKKDPDSNFAEVFDEFKATGFTGDMSMKHAYKLGRKSELESEVRPHAEAQVEPRSESQTGLKDHLSLMMHDSSILKDLTYEQRQRAIEKVRQFLAKE
jgi:uncharacterized protein (UPF0335 family)